MTAKYFFTHIVKSQYILKFVKKDMKTSYCQRLLFSIAITLFFSFTSYSQFVTRSGINQANTQILMINNYPVAVENLTFSDAIGGDGSMLHSVAFNFRLYQEDLGISNLLSALQKQNSKMGYGEWSFSIYTLNYNRDIVEQRNYSAINVQEFSLSPLEANEKNTPVKGNIRLTALKMNLVAGNGKANFSMPKPLYALTSNFSLSLGNLPTKFMSGLSPLVVTPIGSNGVNFTIILNANDAATWNREFASGNTNNLQGLIKLYEPNMQTVVKTIYINNAKITSISTINNTIPKLQVVLNAQTINIQ